jgi:hypothetical protein
VTWPSSLGTSLADECIAQHVADELGELPDSRLPDNFDRWIHAVDCSVEKR